MHDSVVIQNHRVSVRSHANTTFYLTIHDVREEDRGHYMCQVNTIPMMSKTGYLEVNGASPPILRCTLTLNFVSISPVPPSFIEHATSSDVDVEQGASVSLHCAAEGRPAPQISWRREDGNPIIINSQHSDQTGTRLLLMSNLVFKVRFLSRSASSGEQ